MGDMSSDQPHLLRVTIEFDPDSTPISGRIEQGNRSPQAFEGMLELISIVEAARRSGDHRAGTEGEPA